MMGKPYGVKVTGEPRDTETVMRGSERDRWKSTRMGNSLAVYFTSCPVLRAAEGADPSVDSPGGDGSVMAVSTRNTPRSDQ